MPPTSARTHGATTPDPGHRRGGGRRARRRGLLERIARVAEVIQLGDGAPALPRPECLAGGGVPRADRGAVRDAAASADAVDARAALLDWLEALTEYAASARGMAEALAQDRLVEPSG